MKQKIGFSSICSLVALLSGCASGPYTQVQLAYSNTRHEKDLGGPVNLFCVRARGGAKIGSKEKDARKEEFRLGADICYGKLPTTSSQQTYSIDVPVAGTQQTDVYGSTKSSLIKVSIPFIEYRYATLERNFPGEAIAQSGIRSGEAKDVSLGMWAAVGYNIDFTASETDYVTNGGTINNIPGMDVEGKFYGELTNEVTLFGRVPLGMSVRVDGDGKVMPVFSGGYKVQW